MTGSISRTARTIAVAALLCAGVGLIYFLQHAGLESQTVLRKAVKNFGHTPLFGLLAVLILWMLQLSLGKRLSRAAIYAWAWLGAAGIGVITEFMQIGTARDADLVDILRNAAGAAAFLAFYFILDPAAPEAEKKRRTRLSIPVAAAAVIILAASAGELLRVAMAYRERDAGCPRLFTFGSSFPEVFLRERDARLEVVDPPAGWPAGTSKVARVTFLPSRYPDVAFKEPCPDWRGYETFRLNVYSGADSTFDLHFSIWDRWRAAYGDRFDSSLPVEPGFNELSIPAAWIEQGPRGRLMDMSSIKVIHIFLVEPKEPAVVYIGDMALE
jgi:hypothetical protein